MKENAFESLCELASSETWCWNLHCTTCGAYHFRLGCWELSRGKHPLDDDWVIHRSRTRYGEELGPRREWSIADKNRVLKICVGADLNVIRQRCAFPDWLGYLGLVLFHMKVPGPEYRELSVHWAKSLQPMVTPRSLAGWALDQVLADENRLLTLDDLEECECAFSLDIRRRLP